MQHNERTDPHNLVVIERGHLEESSIKETLVRVRVALVMSMRLEVCA